MPAKVVWTWVEVFRHALLPTAPGVVTTCHVGGGDSHPVTQGSQQPQLFLSYPRAVKNLGWLCSWLCSWPPGLACGFIKHRFYFNELLRNSVRLIQLLSILGYGREWKFGNDMTGKWICKIIPSGSVRTIFYNLCQILIQLPLSIAFTCFFQ